MNITGNEQVIKKIKQILDDVNN